MRKDPDQLIVSAAQAHATGRLEEAERMASEALTIRPNDLDAMLILGILGVKKNDPALAIPNLQRILQKDPTSFDASLWLSVIFRKMGQMPDALGMAQLAVKANNQSPHAFNQLGLCLLDLNEREPALAALERACTFAPKEGPFFENLGRALQSLGRNREAISAYRRALTVGPMKPVVMYRLGEAFMAENRMIEAAECGRKILQIHPKSIQGNILLASALIGSGDVEEGAQFAKKAVELSPNDGMPAAYYGRALQSLGLLEEAEVHFKRSIELEPRQGFAYHSLVHNHRVKEDEWPLVTKMEELTHDAALPLKEIIQLQYGLGKALEDLGEFERAMVHFDVANRIDHDLKVGVVPFNREELKNTADFLIATFTPVFFEACRPAANPSELPIFVVGMMRSGTTLAEQILSSHPKIGGAGEQLFWPDNAGAGQRLFRSPDPSSILLPQLAAMAADYLTLLQSLAPGKEKVVDKMNTNYLLLGLLHIAFPNARIVHMNRHPVDTCLSIWATPVANGIDLCGSKENIVFAYEQYLRVMEHWRQVLPKNRLLDVSYEELVADRETITRQMVDFCGLEWDEACLRHEKNQRSVKTPSVWQVRQPIYKTSVERWRRYEPWLGAFAQLFSHNLAR